MPRSEEDLIGKIAAIRGIISSWGTLPINPTEFLDTQPFWGQAFLVKIGDQIKIRTCNVGDLDISIDDLMGRMGIGMDYLSMLENRLSIFKEIFDEVAMDPSSDTAYIREEVARERGDQELKEISGWEGPSRERIGFIWTKSISGTILKIAYFRDSITGEYVTRGLIIPFSPRPQWLIKDGRKYEWLVRPQDRDILFTQGFVDFDMGEGGVIDDDISTPVKMAAYLGNSSNH